jgi:sensor c-di-GMP phosphodiesterase-like protein
MMRRRDKVLTGAVISALLGVTVLFSVIVWLFWRESLASEETYEGGLAATLGQRTASIFIDTRDMLAAFDKLDSKRCSEQHLQSLRDAAVSRPFVRGIGYWQADERVCGVGFLPEAGLKPSHADHIYDNGVIAWWPSKETEVGGVQLFLMRFGNHDVAIDPRLLLDFESSPQRQAGLWVEKMRMSAVPWDAAFPPLESIPMGITVENNSGVVISHFAHNDVLPIDVVAREPIGNFWSRHGALLAIGIVLGVMTVIGWLDIVTRLSRRQLEPATELKRAIAACDISVHYQPVMDLRTSKCVGAEALARWQTADGKWVSPNIFIPIAEKAGLIQELTLCVMHILVRDLKSIHKNAGPISINLNLSPDDLQNDRVARELEAALKEAGLPSNSVKLEITERALVNADSARKLIGELRGRGHEVAIDDFGTGYSSLSYLQSFELDVLKIDKSFVDAIGTGAATSHVIVHVIDMAKSLGLNTVAEGVETTQQAQWLIEHGVQCAQGYLFAKPLPLADFLVFFRARRNRN